MLASEWFPGPPSATRHLLVWFLVLEGGLIVALLAAAVVVVVRIRRVRKISPLALQTLEGAVQAGWESESEREPGHSMAPANNISPAGGRFTLLPSLLRAVARFTYMDVQTC